MIRKVLDSTQAATIAAAGPATPTKIDTNVRFTISAYTQMVFSRPIKMEEGAVLSLGEDSCVAGV